MLIEKRKYDKLSQEEKMSLEYSNPCTTENPKYIRVGEVFDSDLGYWRNAFKSDF